MSASVACSSPISSLFLAIAEIAHRRDPDGSMFASDIPAVDEPDLLTDVAVAVDRLTEGTLAFFSAKARLLASLIDFRWSFFFKHPSRGPNVPV